MRLAYRPEVDGLRAIAVLVVMLYHFGIPGFGGGFVGVDIFFVISGFLITKMIRDETLQTGQFAFGNFYIRRARRLFPALAVTLAGSFAAGYLILAPEHFQEFCGSLVYAVISASNFYFWSQSGYFDAAATLKPLLHTWSLSVEEQFYLLWPMFIVALLKARRSWVAPACIAGIGLFSLGLNLWFEGDRPAIFYLAPFRIFEFSIGAMVIYAGRPVLLLGEIAVAAGIGLIAWSIFEYTSATPFPSTAALAPCAGAALLIYAQDSLLSGALLKNAVMTAVGRISYSLYLLHWPLIVFYRYFEIEPPTIGQNAALMLIAMIGAAAMYRFVEQPFRTNRLKIEHSYFVAACVLSAVAIGAPSASAWAHGGWLWRYPKSLTEQLSFKPEEYNLYVGRRAGERYKPFENDGRPTMMVIGDSQAGDVINAMAESGLDAVYDIKSIPSLCPVMPDDVAAYARAPYAPHAKVCEAQLSSVKQRIRSEKPDIVVLTAFWSDWAIDLVPETVTFLRSAGVGQAFVIGSKILPVTGPQFLATHGLRANLFKLRVPYLKQSVQWNARLAHLGGDFEFINPLDLFCDGAGCEAVAPDGYLIMFDNLHLTPHGAKYLGSKLAEILRARISQHRADP